MLLIPALVLMAIEPQQPIVIDAERLRRDPEAVVCKSQSQKNSRFRTRICRSAADWDRIAEATKRDYQEYVDGPKFDTRGGQ